MSSSVKNSESIDIKTMMLRQQLVIKLATQSMIEKKLESGELKIESGRIIANKRMPISRTKPLFTQ